MKSRDAQGRFVKGHQTPGPGRPPLAAELPVKVGVAAAASAETVAQVLEKLAAMALEGNVRAAGVYLAYTIGKPVEMGFEDRLAALEAALNVQGKV